jgi:hypothetical protein
MRNSPTHDKFDHIQASFAYLVLFICKTRFLRFVAIQHTAQHNKSSYYNNTTTILHALSHFHLRKRNRRCFKVFCLIRLVLASQDEKFTNYKITHRELMCESWSTLSKHANESKFSYEIANNFRWTRVCHRAQIPLQHYLFICWEWQREIRKGRIKGSSRQEDLHK